MKIKKMICFILLSSLVGFTAYGMEKPDEENSYNFDQMDIEEELPQGDCDIWDVVIGKDVKKAKILLDEGADVNYVKRGIHLLAVAASDGCSEMVDLLLKKGADIYKEHDFEGEKFNALDWALINDYYTIAKALINNGFDVNREGQRGLPLKLAYGECVKLLLERGADPNKLNSKEVPAWFDTITGRDDLDSCLNIHNSKFRDILKLFHKYGANLRFKDKDGRTVIFYLIDHQCINLIECLCELDLDVAYIPDNKGITPLQYAQKYLQKHGQSYVKDIAEVEGRFSKKRRLSKVATASRKKMNAYVKKQSETFGSKEFLNEYKRIVDFLKEGNLKRIKNGLEDDLKKAALLSLYARYNKPDFDICHDRNMAAYENAETIEGLTRTLLQDQKGRDLSPYISARAPKMVGLINYIKTGDTSGI
jgi:ankyrin repeat protein